MAPRGKPAAPGSVSCPLCGGSGLIITDDGVGRPCECGILDANDHLWRVGHAGIPARFARKTLDRYEVAKGDSVRQNILRTARSYAESFEPTHDGLLLRGCVGAGKTHIAIGILQIVIQKGYTGAYWGFVDLLARLRASYSRDNEGETEREILDEVDGADLLVLDDVGAEATTEWVRDRLYLIINRRYESTRPVIITTNCSEEELRERIGPRTASRLYEMCRHAFPAFPSQDYRVKAMS